MQLKVMPLCLGMGIGMVVMKMVCNKTMECQSQDSFQENTECCHKHSNEKIISKAKEKIDQVVSEIEKLEMGDVKVKTKEALEQIKTKILSIHL